MINDGSSVLICFDTSCNLALFCIVSYRGYIYIYTAGFGFVFWWVDFCLPNWPMVGKCPRSSQLASRYFQDKRLGEDSTESLDAKS